MAPGPEQQARGQIDRLLAHAGWSVQHVAGADLAAALGVAIREFPLLPGHGFADYLLYVDGKACGVIEAKKQDAKRADLDEFVALYNPANRHQRQATWAPEPDSASGCGPDGRWRVYEYEELVARDKASLDIFWLKDESLADSDNLPPPEVIAQEIVDDLEAALEQFRLIAGDLNGTPSETPAG
jgi:hypothetical protein